MLAVRLGLRPLSVVILLALVVWGVVFSSGSRLILSLPSAWIGISVLRGVLLPRGLLLCLSLLAIDQE